MIPVNGFDIIMIDDPDILIKVLEDRIISQEFKVIVPDLLLQNINEEISRGKTNVIEIKKLSVIIDPLIILDRKIKMGICEDKPGSVPPHSTTRASSIINGSKTQIFQCRNRKM
ncbi:hypothetical protein HN800_02385 [bacterium]|jgi:hypothetical protein|nr:hypothetical protein [bacterium]MBT4763915.1 hypothetical protein [bacterium]MBT5401286.1 hypothetical protein [bacterium]MBT5942755.1 hypothetical protein [bacterium]MBT6067760.1 hypothetical protein [bacterium]